MDQSMKIIEELCLFYVCKTSRKLISNLGKEKAHSEKVGIQSMVNNLKGGCNCV